MKVVLATNDSAISDALRETLELDKVARISAITSLEECLNQSVRDRPDILLLVMSEPFETVFEVLRDARDLLSIPVLVIGPVSDPQLVLRCLRGGAYQFLGLEECPQELSIAMRRARSSGIELARQGKLMTIVGAGGGSGATTLAVNLAVSLMAPDRKVALIDLNLEHGDMSSFLDLNPPHSVADFCRNLSRMDSAMFQQCFVAHSSGVRLLAAPPPRDIGHVTLRGVRQLLGLARRTFEYVVVDLDRSSGPQRDQGFWQSDVIVVVVRLDFSSLRRARRTLDYLDEIKISRDRIRVVVNRERRSGDLAVNDVERALGMRPVLVIPEDAYTVDRGTNRGIPLVADLPRSQVAKRLRELAVQLNGAVPHKK